MQPRFGLWLRAERDYPNPKAPCTDMVTTWALKGLLYHDFGACVYTIVLLGAFGKEASYPHSPASAAPMPPGNRLQHELAEPSLARRAPPAVVEEVVTPETWRQKEMSEPVDT